MMTAIQPDFYEVKSGWLLDEAGGRCGLWFQRGMDTARRVINFEEERTRAALIALGWTPPLLDDDGNPV